jgi:hypothetical protein
MRLSRTSTKIILLIFAGFRFDLSARFLFMQFKEG